MGKYLGQSISKLLELIKGEFDNKLERTENAVSASKLAQQINISLTGDVSGSASLDGSTDVEIPTTVKNTIQYTTMPEPTANGSVIQYIGATTGNYNFGSWYRCENNQWVEIEHDHSGEYLRSPSYGAGINIPVSSWVADTTYANYPYRASIMMGVNEYSFVDVVFGVEDASSGNFAPGGDTTANGEVYIYAKQIPETEIRLVRIIDWKGLSG